MPADARRTTANPLKDHVTRLTLNQRVLGSSPSAPTNPIKHLGGPWGLQGQARVRSMSANAHVFKSAAKSAAGRFR